MYNCKIDIDRDICNSCKTCFNSCFLDVFRWDEGEDMPIAAYQEDCVGCLACEVNCPEQCIEILPTIPVGLPSPF